MVKLKFIIKDGVLVLRISELKTRYYKRVGHLLKGSPNLKKHWKQDKEKFSNYAISYAENNKTLDDYKQIYTNLIKEHPELSAKQVSGYYVLESKCQPLQEIKACNEEDYSNSVMKYLETVILREKAKQGCNYESYYKLLLRCNKTIPSFQSLSFPSLTYNKMVSIAYIFAKGKGYRNMSKTFRALLGRASNQYKPKINFNPFQYLKDWKGLKECVTMTTKELNKELYAIFYDIMVDEQDCSNCKYCNPAHDYFCNNVCGEWNDRFQISKDCHKDVMEKVKEVKSLFKK